MFVEFFKRLDAKTPKIMIPLQGTTFLNYKAGCMFLWMKTHLYSVRKKQCDSHLFSNIYSDGQSKVYFSTQSQFQYNFFSNVNNK